MQDPPSTQGEPGLRIAAAAPPTATEGDLQERQGAELIKATGPFEVEQRWRSWRLLLETLAVLAGLLGLVCAVHSWPVQVLAGLLAGLMQVRLFIFYHDAMHGAIFRKDPLGQAIMSGVGFYLLMVRSVWKETHDYHHQHNARKFDSWIGTFPILTVAMAQQFPSGKMRVYRIFRHRLTILAGSLTMALIGMVVSPFLRKPGRHWTGLLAVVLHVALFLGVLYGWGWVSALCAVSLPYALSMAIGSYLFYAQHNFPDLRLAQRDQWSYTEATLHASSMFEMSPLMHWFTGNIGFHHVHHLNHRIPFYRLREAMQAIPELQNPGRTSWRLRDIRACLDLYVWDPDQARMLTYAEAG